MSSQPGPHPQHQASQYPAPPSAPSYAQAPFYPQTHPKPPGERMSPLDVSTGLLLLGAVAVGMVGSFQTAYKMVYPQGGESDFVVRTTNWFYQSGETGMHVNTRLMVSGFALAVASAVAALAAILLLAGVGRRAASVRGLGAVGAGSVVGVGLTDLLSTWDAKRLSDGTLKSWSYGAGFWLTLVAMAPALVGLVLSVLSLRSPRPASGWNPGTAQPQYAYAQAAYTVPQAYAPMPAAGYQPQQQWSGPQQQPWGGPPPQPPQPSQTAQFQYQPQPQPQPQYQAQPQPQPQHQAQPAAAVPPTIPQQPRPASPPPTIPEQPADSMPTMRTTVLQQPVPVPQPAASAPAGAPPQTDAVPPSVTPPSPTVVEEPADQMTHVTPLATDRLPSPSQISDDASGS